MNFTFNSDGQVLFKKRIDMARLPDQQKKCLEIKSVSNIQTLKNLPPTYEMAASFAGRLNDHIKSGATIVNSASDQQMKKLLKVDSATKSNVAVSFQGDKLDDKTIVSQMPSQ